MVVVEIRWDLVEAWIKVEKEESREEFGLEQQRWVVAEWTDGVETEDVRRVGVWRVVGECVLNKY